MPSTARAIWRQLAFKEELDNISFQAITEWGSSESGIKINKEKPLFPRIKSK
jgi:methionyl-tRNA synthetase